MKNTIILLLVVCIFFSLPMSSQTCDSTVNDKAKAVKECSTDLLLHLEANKIQETYPKEFKMIMNYLDDAKKELGKIEKNYYTSKNMKFADKAIQNYNKARSIYNQLIKKKS